MVNYLLAYFLQINARFGLPSEGMTAALRECMGMEDAEVIGCVAKLATVRDEGLNRLLSTLHCSDMRLLVVEGDATRVRVDEHLRAGGVRPFMSLPANAPPCCMHENPLFMMKLSKVEGFLTGNQMPAGARRAGHAGAAAQRALQRR